MVQLFSPEGNTGVPAVHTRPQREDGALIEDGIQKGTTQRCPHCGGHFIVAASGNFETAKKQLGDIAKPRVFCAKCNKLTCGRVCCHPETVGCIPLEARLEHIEGKTPAQYADLIWELQTKGIPLL